MTQKGEIGYRLPVEVFAVACLVHNDLVVRGVNVCEDTVRAPVELAVGLARPGAVPPVVRRPPLVVRDALQLLLDLRRSLCVQRLEGLLSSVPERNLVSHFILNQSRVEALVKRAQRDVGIGLRRDNTNAGMVYKTTEKYAITPQKIQEIRNVYRRRLSRLLTRRAISPRL